MVVEVRFLRSSTGARIAYTVQGHGPPLICLPPWATHLEAQRSLSGHRAFHEALSRHHTVVLYDRLGTGLSDRERDDFSLDVDVEVLRDVVDHLRLRRFAVFGPSDGGLVAALFARAHPRRVSHLVLYGIQDSELTDLTTWGPLRELILANVVVATNMIAAVAVAAAGAGVDDIAVCGELMRASATPQMMVALQDGAKAHDMAGVLEGVNVPTLVLHRSRDRLVTAESASLVAGRIPGARLEMLDDEPHIHFVGDVGSVARHVVAFTAGSRRSPSAHLSPREAEIMALVASGCTNAQVAQRLVLSVRTVERHLLNAYIKLGVRGRSEATARWLNAPRANSSGR
ncbi:MAG TPA: alpha/beta fold hydrolase [Actinomycetales bacterium]|nr:alpha/beta fold hydrolase [Actinomycetales bacterium]